MIDFEFGPHGAGAGAQLDRELSEPTFAGGLEARPRSVAPVDRDRDFGAFFVAEARAAGRAGADAVPPHHVEEHRVDRIGGDLIDLRVDETAIVPVVEADDAIALARQQPDRGGRGGLEPPVLVIEPGAIVEIDAVISTARESLCRHRGERLSREVAFRCAAVAHADLGRVITKPQMALEVEHRGFGARCLGCLGDRLRAIARQEADIPIRNVHVDQQTPPRRAIARP